MGAVRAIAAVASVLLVGAACGSESGEGAGSLVDYCMQQVREFTSERGLEDELSTEQDLRESCEEWIRDEDVSTRAEVDAWIRLAGSIADEFDSDDLEGLFDLDDETESPGDAAGRDHPVPLGQRTNIGEEWQVTLLEVETDATQRILAENPFNEPPEQGRHFVLGRFEVSYVGDESGTPAFDLSIQFAGSAGNTFGRGMADYCGVIPDPLSDVGEMFPGASAQGYECVSVPSDQISGGAFMVEASFSFRPTRVFFAFT